MKDLLEVVGAVLGFLLFIGVLALFWCITPDQDYGAPSPTSMQQ